MSLHTSCKLMTEERTGAERRGQWLQRWIGEKESEGKARDERWYTKLQRSRAAGDKRRHKYASSWAIFCRGALTLAARYSSDATVILLAFSSAPCSPPPDCPLQTLFPVSTHTHTQAHTQSRANRHMHQASSVVSLLCVKTNISSLQINYQPSPWPASVISLSGNRSDGLYCVLSPCSTRTDSYFPLSRGLSTPNTMPPPPPHPPLPLNTTNTTLSPSRCVGREDEPVKQSLPELALCQGELSHVP